MNSSYRESVQPHLFSDVPSRVSKMHRRNCTGFPGSAVLFVDLFRLVSGSSYSKTGRYPLSSEEMMDRLDGDCQDQSVLLCSLYEAASISTRLVAVTSSRGNKHILPEFRVSREPGKFADLFAAYYSDVFGEEVGEICWEYCEEERCYWFVADPVMSSYVGDLDGLDRMGYVDFDGSGNWKWVEARSYISI